MLPVSVVIPTFNCDLYLADAINSALIQEPHEVIVIDDGSTDQTGKVLESFSHPNLYYVRQSNQGVSAARNVGIHRAECELIAFLDADDCFLPGKLVQQTALFETDPDLGLVQSGWQRVAKTGEVLTTIKPWQSRPELTLETWLQFKPILPSALMIKRSWLKRVQGFDPQFEAAEDLDLVCRLALQGCRAAWHPQVAVSYRQRTRSAMGNGSTQARDLAKFLDKFFQQPALPESIQMLEKSVRYQTLIWAAWYLYHTKNISEMTQYLKQAWHYTPYLPVEALLHWVESFTQFSEDWHGTLNIQDLVQSPEWQSLVRWLMKNHS